MSFSAKGSVHTARSVDEMVAAEWALEDLRIDDLYADLSAEPLVGTDASAEEQRARAEAAAREELERRVREAYQRGLEEGRREGAQAEAARLKNAVRAAEAALEEVRENEARWLANIEENICAVAVAVARHVVDRELETDPEMVARVVRRALDEFPVKQPVRVRVHPRDQAVIESTAGEGRLPTMIDGREVQWIADVNIVPGGCLVEGRDRIIDGRVDTALMRAYRRLTYALS
ncbi:MAG TPA: FliH/SctL family protein [Longimicrobiaceae bacterium]